MILISSFHHFFKLSIQNATGLKQKTKLPENYSELMIVGGYFHMKNSLFEKNICFPEENDAFIHGVIKNYYLGDLIFNCTKKMKTSLQDLYDLIFSKVKRIEKAMKKIVQINHLKKNFNARITHFRDSRLDMDMLKQLADQNSQSNFSVANSQQFSNSNMDSKTEKTGNVIQETSATDSLLASVDSFPSKKMPNFNNSQAKSILNPKLKIAGNNVSKPAKTSDNTLIEKQKPKTKNTRKSNFSMKAQRKSVSSVDSQISKESEDLNK